jgi:xanthine dehydrogenase accessory factor
MAAGAGNGALASVARRKGSLPMSATAKMLVSADGARVGTVGGGCLEAEITERALEVIQRGEPAISEHTLNAELAGDYGLTCGGTAVMFIEPVFHDAVLHSVYEGCAGLVRTGERGVLATAVSWLSGPQKALLSSGVVLGNPDRELKTLLANFGSSREEYQLGPRAFVEPILGPARLVVFGGGHVGASIAQAAAFAGWRVTVADDREEYASAARFPFAENTLVCEYHAIPPELLLDEMTYVVVATRGHQHDALIVEQLAGRSLRYLGMLGSRRKVALTWKMLESMGVEGDGLQKIHAPIGISIGADTPQEIAISVVAQMISVRRSGSRRRGGIAVHDGDDNQN